MYLNLRTGESHLLFFSAIHSTISILFLCNIFRLVTSNYLSFNLSLIYSLILYVSAFRLQPSLSRAGYNLSIVPLCSNFIHASSFMLKNYVLKSGPYTCTHRKVILPSPEWMPFWFFFPVRRTWFTCIDWKMCLCVCARIGYKPHWGHAGPYQGEGVQGGRAFHQWEGKYCFNWIGKMLYFFVE